MLKRIFGSRRDEVTGQWAKLHDEAFHKLNSSQNISHITSGRMRSAGFVARRGEMVNAYKTLVVKRGGKKLLGRSKRRCEEKIKMYTT